MNKKVGTLDKLEHWVVIGRTGRVYKVSNLNELEEEDRYKIVHFKSNGTECIVELK